MMGTLGKNSGRFAARKLAFFRAIGARNTDIAMIYAVYSAILAMVAFVVAAVISTLFALFLTLKFSPKAKLRINSTSWKFRILFMYDLLVLMFLHWLVLLSLLISAALLGAVIPVLRTLHKDPILAMRDE
jgi:ABC-type antimicrobial peptide transport system permease subunit